MKIKFHKGREMKKIILIIPCLLFICLIEIYSQTILPLISKEEFITKFDSSKKFYLIGTGQLSFEKLDQSSISTKLTTYFRPNPKYGFFITMNKAVLDNKISSDSISLKNSIVFPDNSSLGFLGNFTYDFVIDEVNFPKEVNRVELNKKYSKFYNSIFVEFGYQNRNVTYEIPSDVGLVETKKLSFDAVFLSIGSTVSWAYYGPISFRASGGISYSINSVNQGFDDFKTLFNINDLDYNTFHSLGIKIALQINALTFSFDGRSILNPNENVKQLKGFQFELGTIVSGDFLSF